MFGLTDMASCELTEIVHINCYGGDFVWRIKMRIAQLYISPGVQTFGDRLKEKYSLRDYTDKDSPAIFYGAFSASPPKILAHRSLAVILWAGTDVLRLLKAFREPDWGQTKKYKLIASKPNIHHICRSACLQEDFDSIGLKYHFLRVSPVLPEYFSVKPLGPDIYCYGVDRKPEKYGGEIIDRLKADFPLINFRSNCLEHETYQDYSQMQKIYRRCFLALRLTQHDGLPNTVLEMGLCGRKCVYNGDLPNALPYRNYQEIKRHIQVEHEKVGSPGDKVISQRIREMLDIPEDWLDTEFYV